MKAKFANIIFGIWDRTVHRVDILDNDALPKLGVGEQMVRMPLSKYKTLRSDQIEHELML